VGTPGPHAGTGRVSVADWWLRTTRVVEEESEAAAAPAMTIERAKILTASFMMSNPSKNFGDAGDGHSGVTKW